MKFISHNRHLLLMAAVCLAVPAVFFLVASSTGSRGFYLLLLLCPAMHVLMHRGAHGSGNRSRAPQDPPPTSATAAVEEQSRPPQQRPYDT